jgi:hypothetical protein
MTEEFNLESSYRAVSRLRWIYTFTVILPLFLLLGWVFTTDHEGPMPTWWLASFGLFLVLTIGSTIHIQALWRCPKCKKPLAKAKPNYCSNCGVKLNPNQPVQPTSLRSAADR